MTASPVVMIQFSTATGGHVAARAVLPVWGRLEASASVPGGWLL
eukprot:COSAG06_NODE_60754_length_270_cov_0.520468_1_plen_43_part_01